MEEITLLIIFMTFKDCFLCRSLICQRKILGYSVLFFLPYFLRNIPFGLVIFKWFYLFLIPYIFRVQINIKPSARVFWKSRIPRILLILIPLTGKIISRKGFNINRMAALCHYSRGAWDICAEALCLPPRNGGFIAEDTWFSP